LPSYFTFAVIVTATIAASMAIVDREGDRPAPPLAAQRQRRTGADGFFVSRCKGASALAEKSWTTPLQEGDHPSVRSGHERKRGSRSRDRKPGKDMADIARFQTKPRTAGQGEERRYDVQKRRASHCS
jgi:hypothetical protein